MPQPLSVQQWVQSLAREAWIRVDSSSTLAADVAAALAKAKSSSSRKPTLTPVPRFKSIKSFPVAPIHLLHAVAKVTTPTVPNLAAFSSIWAERRYIWAFDPQRVGAKPELRLSQYSSKLDFHQKTLLSDDLGMAVATYVIETVIGASKIANATAAVEAKMQGAIKLSRKWPDLVCTTTSGSKVYVVECKGSGSGWSETRRQMVQAAKQVMAIGFNPAAKVERYILATQMAKGRFVLHALDPPRSDHAQEEKVVLRSRDVLQLDAARRLPFCGDYKSAFRQLPDGTLKLYPALELPSFEPVDFASNRVDAVGMIDRWRTPSGDSIEVFRGLDRAVHEAITQSKAVNPRYSRIESGFQDKAIDKYSLAERGDREEGITSVSSDGTVLSVRVLR